MEILDIENLSFTYASENTKALDNINFSVRRGEFVVVCGKSGCGKTTLFKMIKSPLAPRGKKEGHVLFYGKDTDTLDERSLSEKIGFVNQNPEAQIVTDRVYHELSFGLESLGINQDKIRLRVGEMASYFGLAPYFYEKTAHLSGGQKQLISLASVMATSPELLILDEPTSQLDPISASDFIATLKKINRELGTTVIISEHRLEELFSAADKIAVLDKGKLLTFDTKENVCSSVYDNDISAGFPTAARIWHALGGKGKCPSSVREGREFLESNFKKTAVSENIGFSENKKSDVVLSLSDVFFRYEKNSDDILRGVSLKIEKGEFFCLLGGNGTGKTTLMKVISGLRKPYRGKIEIFGKDIKKYTTGELYKNLIAMLPQCALDIFIKNTIREDFDDISITLGDDKKTAREKTERIAKKLGISDLLSRHPYDVSGGETQKCAIAKLLLTNPRFIILDEPTKALDAAAKKELAAIINSLKNDGVSVLAVTHDVEFAAENADRCALFFAGEIISPSKTRRFFSDNNFYTTAASRISRGIFDGAVTAADIISLGKGAHHE